MSDISMQDFVDKTIFPRKQNTFKTHELTMDWLKMNSLHKSERSCSFLVMFGLLTSVIWQKPDMFLSLLCSCLKVVVVSRTKPGIASCEVTMLLIVCSGMSIFVYD